MNLLPMGQVHIKSEEVRVQNLPGKNGTKERKGHNIAPRLHSVTVFTIILTGPSALPIKLFS